MTRTSLMCLGWMLVAWIWCGCNAKDGSSNNGSTNLSIAVWAPFPQKTNSYHRAEHLQVLLQQANSLIATNPAIFSQKEARGKLRDDSPLRGLLGIPRE